MISPEAFEAAFADGFSKTVKFMLKKGCLPSDVEDIVQTAWTKAWEKREQFRGDSSIWTWVAIIAINLLKGEWRRPKREHVGDGDLANIGIAPTINREIEVAQLISVMDARSRRTLVDYYLLETGGISRVKAHRAILSVRIKMQGIRTAQAKRRAAA